MVGKEQIMIYDISPPITITTKVWPGEPSVQQEIVSKIQNGSSVTVSILHTTVHIGAHADAPCHFIKDALSIGEIDLSPYIGPCQVIQILCQPNEVITPDRLTVPIYAERILIKTQTSHKYQWTDDFGALSPKLIDFLNHQKVKLIGIDTPSVDPYNSKTLEAHKKFFANGIYILEGLDLANVPEGLYELIALPLKLMNFDASPVRAILREIGES
jgi:arylformamidase